MAGVADEVWQVIPVEKRDTARGNGCRSKVRGRARLDARGAAIQDDQLPHRPVSTQPSRPWEPLTSTIRTDTPNEAKTLNLLWNSTPVLMQLLSMRAKSAAYIHWSGTQLRERQTARGRSGAQPRANACRGTRTIWPTMEIGRLQCAADDPVRATIDDATSELFGLTCETVAQWRTWLSQEPFMHNASPVDD